MSTQQAEEVLKHTFKQLEKMLNDVRRQPHVPAPGKKTIKKDAATGQGKKKE